MIWLIFVMCQDAVMLWS